MKTNLAVLAGILVLGTSLQASTSFVFNGTGAGTGYQDATGAAQTYAVGGITATLTAYNASAYGGTLSAASLGQYSGNGIGVCSVAEGGPGCTSTGGTHQIDNRNGYDFVLISFSTAVTLNSIQLGFFGGDGTSVATNMSYWTNVTTSVVNGVTIYDSTTTHGSTTGSVKELAEGAGSSAPGTGQTNIVCQATGEDACPANGSFVTYDSSNPGTNAFTGTGITNLLISAQYVNNITTSNDSFFKLAGLTVSTPEPASFILIGSGLLAGALFGRKLRKANSNA